MTARKNPEDKLKLGRPTLYNEEIVKRICDVVSTNTIGLRRLTQIFDDLPDESTIRLWRRIYPDFSLRYAQAKLFQAELLAEECLDIADDASNDWMQTFNEEEQPLGWRVNGEHIHRSRVRIDTRKWWASKLLPKKYGYITDASDGKNPEMDKELEERRKQLDEENKKEY